MRRRFDLNPPTRLLRLRRRAFSLLEILLALAILGGSLAVLSQIAHTGIDAARESRDLALARILCQSKLNEVLLQGTMPMSVPAAEVEPFDSQSTTPFFYSVDVQPAPLDNLLVVRVSVEGRDPDGGPALARYSLTRWMIDPTLGLEAAEAEEEAAKEADEEEAEGAS